MSMRGKKSLIIACALMIIAAAGMTAVYVGEQQTQQKEQERLAQLESEQEALTAQREAEEQAEEQKALEEAKKKAEETAEAASILKAQEAEIEGQTDASMPAETDMQVEDTKETAATAKQVQTLHFSEESTMNWPLQGNVILNYSMDQTVYFATLEQYKYNPAVVIAGAVNDRVCAAATGTVSDISTNETTGCTVTMDLGDGYSAIYGQLKSVPYEVGDTVAQGKLVGYIAEPTKYYSVEGSNLYFSLQKDGTPVDPVTFFE